MSNPWTPGRCFSVADAGFRNAPSGGRFYEVTDGAGRTCGLLVDWQMNAAGSVQFDWADPELLAAVRANGRDYWPNVNAARAAIARIVEAA